MLPPARKVNPKVQVIIKYPQWYDNFHVRGYEVRRETDDFDKIWVGTETRDYQDKRWGGTVQYEAYFIMRWLGGIGGAKCGGGWYDPFGTTENTYLEQARQTILGGARESMLFCYGALQRDTGPKNIEALRAQLPELLAMAKNVHGSQIVNHDVVSYSTSICTSRYSASTDVWPSRSRLRLLHSCSSCEVSNARRSASRALNVRKDGP